ncbi:MAG: DUF1080 domain-containing protein, partial [Candidatus Hydrogenedentes bacterium]|nr:DUF1080 domain-containing protein [Candidatus Hydrogenedentota bacterium]
TTLTLATMAVLTLPALAADVAEGNWINLFDGESLFGWTQFGDVNWEAGDGVLSASADKGVGGGGWLASTSQFKNFELTAEVKMDGPGSMGLAVRAGLEGHVMDNGGATIYFGDEKNDKKWHTIHVKAVGSNIDATIDGKKVDISASRDKGYVLIQFHRYHRFNKHKFGLQVQNVKLRPLGLSPVFDGKTLEGWNIIPDRASIFTVKDGAINIKDGNGQIETAGVYKDFVLQLDIISNGKELNSGVFYRGPVGVFWKGYESQVRNHWKGDDRTQPVDFGTGGNYGNVPARKVVSTDGEWFQKTVICEGNHTAIWINGYQTSDFYDSRPTTDNNDGKNGYVPGPGTIHLQGHDPTTDLSFKNINVQEY